MKNVIVVLFLIFSGLMNSCSTKKLSGETISAKEKPQGLIEVTSKGYGSLKSESVNNAVHNAFTNILVYGIPQSNQKRPLLGNQAVQVFERNKKYFDKFFKNDLSSFILNQKVLSFNPTNITEASSEVWMEINLDALRRKLENDKIISTFGL
jgi:hypothetical protein